VLRWLTLWGILLVGRTAAAVELPSNPEFDLQGALQAYHESVAERQYLEAGESVKLALAALLQDPDHDRMVYGQLLTLLADSQFFAGQYGAAIQNYELAIDAIQYARDRLDNALVTPLLGLSRCLAATRRYHDAIRNYQQSLHVHQVNNGLYGEQTAEIVDELSEVYFASSDFDRAKGMQDLHVAVIEREFPGDNIARLPSMYSRADMYFRTGDYLRSYNGYRRIISLIESAEGNRSLQLVPALTATAALLAGSPIVDGEDGTKKARRYLRRAIAITEGSEQASVPVKADAHIEMGDFLITMTANSASAIRSYQRGWTYLDSDPQFHERRDDLLGQVRLLNPIPAGTPASMLSLLSNAANPDTVKNGYIMAEYDVGPDGRSENVRIVESTPAGLHDYIVRNHVQNFAFRPRFADGEPVPATGLVFELQFSYTDDDLPESIAQQ
jgi:tetratricopeptide (TPR) repeat protein